MSEERMVLPLNPDSGPLAGLPGPGSHGSRPQEDVQILPELKCSVGVMAYNEEANNAHALENSQSVNKPLLLPISRTPKPDVVVEVSRQGEQSRDNRKRNCGRWGPTFVHCTCAEADPNGHKGCNSDEARLHRRVGPHRIIQQHYSQADYANLANAYPPCCELQWPVSVFQPLRTLATRCSFALRCGAD